MNKVDKKLICIVDDDKTDREIAEEVLTGAGYEAVTFSSGAALLGAIEGLKPDCVVIDVRMPRINGNELMEMVTLRWSEIPVIMLSGQITVSEAIDAVSRGATDFVAKPYRPDELLEAIKEALKGGNIHVTTSEINRPREEILAKISPRELEVLKLLLAGESNKSIAFSLGISPRTVEVHRSNMMKRLKVGSFAELIRIALQANIFPD